MPGNIKGQHNCDSKPQGSHFLVIAHCFVHLSIFKACILYFIAVTGVKVKMGCYMQNLY